MKKIRRMTLADRKKRSKCKDSKEWLNKAAGFTRCVREAMKIRGIHRRQLLRETGIRAKDILSGKHNFLLSEITILVEYFSDIMEIEYGDGVTNAVINIKMKKRTA